MRSRRPAARLLGRVRAHTVALLLLAATVIAAPAAAVPLDTGAAPRRDIAAFVTYQVGAKGDVEAGATETLAAVARATLNDPRGWALNGRVHFAQVRRSDELRIWLAAPHVVAAAADGCSHRYSCRVGKDVYINVKRWQHGAQTYRGRLADYRQYVLNHEVGHWLSLEHRDCAGRGRRAPVMQQQTISLDGCAATVWPSALERRRALQNLPSVDVRR